MLVPSALSIWPMAASTVQDRPGQYSAAEALNSWQVGGRRRSGGTDVDRQLAAQLLDPAARPQDLARPWLAASAMLTPGALISAGHLADQAEARPRSPG